MINYKYSFRRCLIDVGDFLFADGFERTVRTATGKLHALFADLLLRAAPVDNVQSISASLQPRYSSATQSQ